MQVTKPNDKGRNSQGCNGVTRVGGVGGVGSVGHVGAVPLLQDGLKEKHVESWLGPERSFDSARGSPTDGLGDCESFLVLKA